MIASRDVMEYSIGDDISLLQREGNFITKWGSYGEEDGQFRDPEHLAIDSEGRVYVSDRKNEIIQVFEPVQ
jgi:tripartite motif-containing protein 71